MPKQSKDLNWHKIAYHLFMSGLSTVAVARLLRVKVKEADDLIRYGCSGRRRAGR